jgi:hypothetical protein
LLWVKNDPKKKSGTILGSVVWDFLKLNVPFRPPRVSRVRRTSLPTSVRMIPYLNPPVVLRAADDILKVWQANPDFRLKDLTLAQLEQEERRLAEVLRKVEEHELSLVALFNERADLALKLHKDLIRVRSGIRGYFGENSSEYEQAGGTRTVERKRSGPKIKKPTAPA